MTTITVDENVWRELNKAKYDLNLPTISEVIRRLLKIAKNIKNGRKKA